ncbi:MAG: histidine kinase [Planctomycetia bacterium]|nr:histidine kinase [Planctomycetia bacterium]
MASYVRGAAEQVGATCVTALDANSLLRRLEEIATPAVVVVNLETRGLDIATLMPRLAELSSAPRSVVAFGPHVHEDRLQAARNAGCTEVLSRGKFHAQAVEILTKSLATNTNS